MLTKKNLKEKNYVGQKHSNKSEICRWQIFYYSHYCNKSKNEVKI